jgi:FkbM family methyltransferase
MYLLRNIRLNKLENVLPFNVALAAGNGIQRMGSPRDKRGDSMTSLLLPDKESAIEVLCLTWQHWLELVEEPKIDCLKMDVEGGEFTLLPSMKKYLEAKKPGLYLSLHPHLLNEGTREREMTRVVETLASYRHYIDKTGMEQKVESLLERDRLHKASSCLFLPV